jgi:transcriptional regulator with XRE-family HTH domain
MAKAQQNVGTNRKDFDRQVAKLLGAQLRKMRDERGWLQADVAKAIDRTTTMLAMIERGSRRATPGDLVRLAYLYGVTIDQLIFGPGPRPKLLSTAGIDLSR